MCGCLSCAPYWGAGPQPRHVPWLGIRLATLWFAGQHSIHWATPARAENQIKLLFHMREYSTLYEIRCVCVCVYNYLFLFEWAVYGKSRKRYKMKEIMNVCHSARQFWNSYPVFSSSVIQLHNDISASFVSTILNANVSQLMPNISEHRRIMWWICYLCHWWNYRFVQWRRWLIPHFLLQSSHCFKLQHRNQSPGNMA